MKWIGITGGIASGKSTVSKMIQDLGGVVLDADVLAREVVSPGSFGLHGLVQIFSGENKIFAESPEGLVLDRSALGQIIFKDPHQKELLERILHPLIQWRAQQERENAAQKGLPRCFYDATLIFEKQMQDRFDAVVLVTASLDAQISRLVARNKLSKAEAELRIHSQMPMEEKIKLADFVIDNNGPVAATKKQVKELYERL